MGRGQGRGDRAAGNACETVTPTQPSPIKGEGFSMLGFLAR